jgi:hypothetical protein
VFDSSYYFEKRSCKKTDKQDSGFLKVHIYTFKTNRGTPYIIEVNEYEGNVFVLKFFPKSLRRSANRYSIFTNEYDSARILRTCLALGQSLYQEKEGKLTVAFMGARSCKEPLLYKTKRWELYRKFITRFFGKESFEHVMSEQSSTYILISKLNDNYAELTESVPTMLLKCHPELEELLDS